MVYAARGLNIHEYSQGADLFWHLLAAYIVMRESDPMFQYNQVFFAGSVYC